MYLFPFSPTHAISTYIPNKIFLLSSSHIHVRHSPTYYRESVPMESQRYGCLHKTEKLHHQLIYKYGWHKFHKVPSLDEQLQAINGSWQKENKSSLGMSPDRLFNPRREDLNTYEPEQTLSFINIIYVCVMHI